MQLQKAVSVRKAASSELKKSIIDFYIADEKASAKGWGNGMRKGEREKRAPFKNLARGPPRA